MPAQTTLFDSKCQPLVDFGTGSKTSAKFSPNGRMICVAGFGNVQGNFEIWDCKRAKKLTSLRNDFTHFEWASDSRHLITAILTPRLKVDNGFKIWNYDGTLLYEQKVNELYVATWLPSSPELYPDRAPSPRVYSQLKIDTPDAQQKPAKYIPPHVKQGLGGAMSINRDDAGPTKYKKPHGTAAPQQRDVPPGYDLEDTKSVKKNQKRRKKKKANSNKEGEDQGEEEDGEEEEPETPAPSPVSEQAPEEDVEDSKDPQKKAKSLQKKLRQIEQLKQQKASGKELEKTQLDKIASEKQLLAELKALKIK